jgi:putative FmdB family regulatory protein
VPTYDYACTACEHRFEAQQPFTDDALTDCPQCQGRLRKIFSAVGIVFKGAGFYRNDSRTRPGSKEHAAAGTKDGVSKDGSTKNGASDSGGSKETSSATAQNGSSSSSSSSGSDTSKESGTSKSSTQSTAGSAA